MQIIEQLMTGSDSQHYGKLEWREGDASHYILRNGEVVFEGTATAVAQRWEAIGAKLAECFVEQELQEFFEEIFQTAGSDVCNETCELLDEAAADPAFAHMTNAELSKHITKKLKNAAAANLSKTASAHLQAAQSEYKRRTGLGESLAELAEGLQRDIKAGLKAHLSKFKAGGMDADDLGNRCVKLADKLAVKHGVTKQDARHAVNAHVDHELGESTIYDHAKVVVGPTGKRAGEVYKDAHGYGFHHDKSDFGEDGHSSEQEALQAFHDHHNEHTAKQVKPNHFKLKEHADCRVCGQTPCNCTSIEEVSAAAMGRAIEHDWTSNLDDGPATHVVKHPKHAGSAVNNVPRAHPASNPSGHKFAVMHHDGTGWKVTKHERIETAAREFGKHAHNGHKVKIVDNKGNVIHSTHEDVLLDDELMSLQESEFLSDK